MKKLGNWIGMALLALVLSLGWTSVQAQSDAITKFFDQYMNDDRFTTVYISGKMFEMMAQVDDVEKEEELAAIVKNLKGLRILTTEQNGKAFYREAKTKISTNGYEVLMNVRDDDGENVEFLVKQNGDTINELLLLVGGEEEFVMMSFVGNLDLAQLSKLAKSMDIEGMEHLENLGDK